MKERGDKEEAEKEEVSGQKVPLDGVIGDAVGVQADGGSKIRSPPRWQTSIIFCGAWGRADLDQNRLQDFV